MRAALMYARAAAIAMVLAADVAGAGAATYYIATGGSDNNNGSLGSPFASFTKAIGAAAGGDTIFVRGGTYNLSSSVTISKSGTSNSPFNLYAYPNESPILDFRGETFSGANSGARGIDLQGNFWHVRGLTVQYAADNGIAVSGSNNTLERLVTRQNQDTGLAIQGSGSRIPSNNLVLNCDSYGNFDFNLASSGLSPGENADGFIAKFRQIGPGNYFIGDRAFNNADDGFDFWEAANGVTVIGSQSFHNGLSAVFRTSTGAAITGYAGDGNGFKLGHDSSTHSLQGDLAWGNPHNGFDINGNATSIELPTQPVPHGVTVVNSTAFNNGTVSGVNFRFDENFAHVLKNNISLSGTVNINSAVVNDHNSWNSGVGVSTSDFVSTTDPVGNGLFHPAGTAGDRDGTTAATFPTVPARQADGSLPTMSFLQLKPGDHLIDAGAISYTDATGAAVTLANHPLVLNFTGVSVTMPGFYGAAPDLGALEYNPFLAGDFNRDGHIDGADMVAMLAALANLPSYKAANNLADADLLALGDINSSGDVTNADVQALISLLRTGGGSLAAVPEPASVTLFAAAISALLLACTRHRAQ